jgi:hypothetical protein
MRPGWAERQWQADVRGGKRDAQHKWPAIRLEWDAASRAEVLACVDEEGSSDA